MAVKGDGVPGMYLGDNRLPVALQGADGGAISLADRQSFKLQLTGSEKAQKARKSLIEDLNADTKGPAADLAGFVRKRQLQTYTSLQRIEEALKEAAGTQTNLKPAVRPRRPAERKRPEQPLRPSST